MAAPPCATAARTRPQQPGHCQTRCLFAVNQNTDNLSFSRRHFLRVAGTIGVLALTKADAAETSSFLSAFFSFDREIQKFMQARNIPAPPWWS